MSQVQSDSDEAFEEKDAWGKGQLLKAYGFRWTFKKESKSLNRCEIRDNDTLQLWWINTNHIVR